MLALRVYDCRPCTAVVSPVSKTTKQLVNESLQLSLSVSVYLHLEQQSLAVKDKNNRGHSTASSHGHFTEHVLDVLLRLDAC